AAGPAHHRPGAQARQRTVRFARTGRGGGWGTAEAHGLAGAGGRPRGQARAPRVRVTRSGWRARVLAAMVALAAAACAKIEPPPGGPPDNTPPRLVSTSPDSLSVIPGFDGEVEFQFSEVVSEG